MSSSRPAALGARRRACLAVVTALLALCGGAFAEQPPAEATYGLKRVVLELEASPRVAPEALLAALVAAGPRALPELRVALGSDKELADEGGDDALTLTEKRAVELEHALAGIPGWVARHVDPSAAASRRELLELRLALEILERSEDGPACPPAIALASPRRADESPHQQIVKALGQTLGARLRAYPREARGLADALTTAHPGLRYTIVRAAGKAPSSETADFLTELLEDDPSLDLLVLSELGRVLSVTRQPVDPLVELRISEHLTSMNPALQREACLTAGRLELFDSTAQLITLLAADDGGLRANALWALERVTGKRMGSDPRRWRTWHAGELAWWSGEAHAAFEKLRSDDPYLISAAMRELSGHRGYRHQITGELLAVLEHEEPSLVAQACAALGALGSAKALPALRKTLSSDSTAVRKAAWEALKAITGRDDLPADPAAWGWAGTTPAAGATNISAPR